jgi:hypothetical protein
LYGFRLKGIRYAKVSWLRGRARAAECFAGLPVRHNSRTVAWKFLADFQRDFLGGADLFLVE